MLRQSPSSPLAKRLLATNEPPSADEKLALKEVFKAIDNDILKAAENLVQLGASCAASEEYSQLLAAREAHEAIMSPMRRLPSDVVFEILRHASSRADPDNDKFLPVVAFDLREAPWPYMSVCCHWRAIITSNSIFWCNIWLQRSPKPTAAVAALHFILDHSKDAPLTISLEASILDLKHASEIIRLLTPHSHRWANISMTFPPDSHCELDEALVKGSVPQLRRLSLEAISDIPSMSGFEFAPNLQALEINSGFLTNLRLPWSQIRELSVTGTCEAPEAVSFLRLMPNLVECSFVLTNDETPEMTVRLPYLRRLDISIRSRGSITVSIEFPKCLEVPVLEEMLVGESDEEIEATARFIRRNSCSIRALTLTSVLKEWTVDDITPLSNAVPSLTSLKVMPANFTLLNLLGDQTKLIFPVLNDLSIETHRCMPTLTSSDLNLVTAVVQNRPLLRKLHISAHRVDSRKTKRRFECDLQRFKVLGLEIWLEFDSIQLAVKRLGF
ncbi:hypothetical protein C8J56DRAFT_862164 [Mycena floridula]|nr:hypothetical protein C8J56DRAFT_862164 [Mycena floridula]